MGQAWLLGGPNGAGKSSAGAGFVSLGVEFVDPDRGLRPVPQIVYPARVAIVRLRALELSGASFCIESTLAGTTHARRFQRLRSGGYRTTLVFMSLTHPDLAVSRVRQRVLAGGHDVPESTIRWRWKRGLENLFDVYLTLFDEWRLYDNSTEVGPVLVAHGAASSEPVVERADEWAHLRAQGGQRDA